MKPKSINKAFVVLLLMLTVALFATTVTVFAAGNEVYLSNFGDDRNDGTTVSTAVQSLDKALELAGDGGTIYVCDKVHIQSDTTIENVTIKRGNGYSEIMFAIEYRSTLTVQNATLDGSGVTATGAIISVNPQSTVVLNDGALVTGNNGAATAINLREASLTMNGGSVSGNTNDGSDNYVYGGAICGEDATVNLLGGSISDNKTYGTYGSGGGLFLYCGSTLTLSGTEITGNYAESNGGGVFFESDSGTGASTLIMDGGSITGNTGKNGSGIYLWNAGMTLDASISGGVISGNNGSSSIAINQSGDNFATLKLSGSPTIEGLLFVFNEKDEQTGKAAEILVSEGFSPANPISIQFNYTPLDGHVAVRYEDGVTPDPTQFQSNTQTLGLKVDGQNLVWVGLYRINFNSEMMESYKQLYIIPGNTIDESLVPTPTKEGYSLLGWRRYSDGTFWNFETDTVDKNGQTLLSWWKADAPTVTVTASAEEVHVGDTITLTAQVSHAAEADMTFSYQWYLDGVAIPDATSNTLIAKDSGSYTVQVVADPGRLEPSDPAESEAVTCTFTHTFDENTWLFDENTHYHVCTVAGCTARNDEAEHTFVWVIDKEATTTEAGSKHQECSVCGYEKEAVEIPVSEPAFKPVIIAGANGTWQKGSSDNLSFTSNAEFADFLKVKVDGKEIDQTSYEVKEGSTIVDLKASYLETLSVCKHTLEVVSVSGTAATEFTIKAAAATTTSTDNTASPQTGDNSNIILWIAVMLAAGTALTGTVLYSCKKKYNK